MKALVLLVILGIFLLYNEFFKTKKFLLPAALLGLAGVIALLVNDWGKNAAYYNNMLIMDNYAIAFNVVIIVSVALIFALSRNYFKGVDKHVSEIYSLITFTLAGTFLMVSYGNLVVLFLGIETMSIPLYILAGSKKFSLRSNEASFKYFILSSIASAIFLFGIVLVYGATVSFHMQGISTYIQTHQGAFPAIFKLGIIFILVGFIFKIAAVPFHFWVPDVYEGSPTLITAFMATVVKTASFAAFFRLFFGCFSSFSGHWQPIIAVSAILTLLGANLAATQQSNVKRMLAYSGIAHSGFMLLAFLTLSHVSANAILYYSLAYSLATIPAFGILIMVKNTKGSNSEISAFNGLGRRNPVFALVMTISLLSLAGIPLTAGFLAKYYIFVNAIASQYLWLVMVAIAGALISVYYYFRIIIAMYFKTGETETIYCDVPYLASLILATLLTIFLGLFPGIILSLNL